MNDDQKFSIDVHGETFNYWVSPISDSPCGPAISGILTNIEPGEKVTPEVLSAIQLDIENKLRTLEKAARIPD